MTPDTGADGSVDGTEPHGTEAALRALEQAALFGNCMIVVRGHADPTLLLNVFVEEGQELGVFTRKVVDGTERFILKDGSTSMTVRVDGASDPFWMVLGQSLNKGWKATADGEDLGEICRIEHAPASDLLVLRRPNSGEVLVPFVKAIVPEVDLSGGRVVLTLPDGLLDL